MNREGRQARIDGVRSASLADAMGRAYSHRSHISGSCPRRPNAYCPGRQSPCCTSPCGTVVSGDYIYSDCDGAVVIPKSEIDSIVNEAMQIERADQLSIEQMKHEHGGPNKPLHEV